MYRAVPLAVLLLLSACAADSGNGADPGDDSPFPAPDPLDGFQMSMTETAPAGTEIWKCKVYDIPTDNWEPVNRVESLQSAGMHHMDIMALAFANVDIAPGEYDCQELYDTYPELMEKGVMLFAAQAAEQTIQLPEGVVANLPPKIRVMHEIHYVNTSDKDVDVFSYVNAYTIHPNDVRETIWGNVVRDTDINIPANTDDTETTRCVMTKDIDLLFVASHTHQLGRSVKVRLFDGVNPGAGEQIYENTDWATPMLESFSPTPLHIAAGTGLEFDCNFSNPTDRDVHWGFTASDEMCQIALVFTPGDASRICQPIDATTPPAP